MNNSDIPRRKVHLHVNRERRRRGKFGLPSAPGPSEAEKKLDKLLHPKTGDDGLKKFGLE